ncbi:unnamed protein product, partial [Urochloa humidicola]
LGFWEFLHDGDQGRGQFIRTAAITREREAAADGQADGQQANKCVLGQVHHRHPWKQVQRWRNRLPEQLRAKVPGHEHDTRQAVPAALNKIKAIQWVTIYS